MRFFGSYPFLLPRQRKARLALTTILLATFALFGCGGGNSDNTLGPVATVELLPTNASLDNGGVLGLSVIMKDAAGHQLFTPTVTFSSSNPLVQVANNGALCAGTWDSLATPIVCTPIPAASMPATGVQTTITATAGGVSSTLTVFVHLHIDSITLTPTTPGCVTKGGTVQYTATAFNGATDITASVGGFNFNIGNLTIATINTADQPVGQPDNKITAKAVGPGLTNIVANSSGTTSLGASFTTCGPATITLHVSGSTDTAFTIAVGATKQLAADVVDSTGATVTGVTLLYESTTAAASATATGLVNGLSPGQSTITASCTPPSCNLGVNTTIYSNPVVATITGTAVAAKIFVTSTGFGTLGCNNASATVQCTPQVIPIPSDTNTPGTPIAIPDVTFNNVATKSIPNSMLISSGGGTLFIGTQNGLTLIDAVASTVTGTVISLPGRVVAVGPGGVKVVIADDAANKVYVFDTGLQAFDTLNISGVKAAAFTPDAFKVYILAGTTLYQYATSQISLRTIPMGDTGQDVAVLPNPGFAYIATASGNMGARATCRNDSTYAPEATVTTDTGLQFVRGVTLSTGTAAVAKMLNVGGASMTVDTPTIGAPAAGTDCPPSIATSTVSANWGGFGIAAFTPRQLITLSNGTQAYVPSDQTVLLGYDVAANTTFTVPVSGASQFTGGALLDSTKVYVGASDNAVHVIDTASRLQTATVPITFSGTTVCNNAAICTPNLVVVQPR